MRILEGLLDAVHERGQALLLYGEAGVGKSSLLAATSITARGRGFQVLSTTGVQSEAHLPFAGLHQLLRPVLSRVYELPGPQRAAMMAAFGMSTAAAPEFFFIALAVLDLLADTAARAPLLVIVEDAHWLDRPTQDVLSFAARRLESEPTIILAAARSGLTGPLDSGFPEMRIEALDNVAAEKLLDARVPGLTPTLRKRILAGAEGNPLALVELPAAFEGCNTWEDGVLPLTTRLEGAFAARASELAELVQTLLLVAATDDGDGLLSEVLRVGALTVGADSVTAEALTPAVKAGLIQSDGLHVRFRHPLVRSAIYRSARSGQRRAAHLGWAQILGDQLDRQAWHRASATMWPDEEVASALEAAADRAQRRGAIPMAVKALERAAQLSPQPTRQSARLLTAAELAFELGRHDLVVRLLAETERLELAPNGRSRIAHLRGAFDDGTPGDRAEIMMLVAMAKESQTHGDTDLALKLLLGAARRSWWRDPGEEVRAAVIAAGERLPVEANDARLLAILALSDPDGHGRVVMERLSEPIVNENAGSGTHYLRGFSAYVVGDFANGERFVELAISPLRTQGRLAILAQALVMKALMGLYRGNWSAARPAAEEARRLAEETAQPAWAAAAHLADAMLAGVRAERDVTAELKDIQNRLNRPVQSSSLLAGIQTARGLTALAEGKAEIAFDHLHQLLDPANPAHHHVYSNRMIGFLAEAAVHSGRTQEGRLAVASLEGLAKRSSSPNLRIGMSYARAVLAEDDRAEVLFGKALSDPQLAEWPFPRARLELAYGTWLRRQRRIVQAREPLRAARDAFDSLGGLHWSERARQELAAAGERSGRRTPKAQERLSPQEFQIAQMAADGLSNREIGQRLYLSHRTIGSHLYRIFPKLDITSRSQLRSAMSAPE